MPAHLIVLDFITRTVLGEQYRSLSSSLSHMVLPSGINETSVVEYLFFHPKVSYYSDYVARATGTFTNPSCCWTS
jgi:hypothetical protein